MNTCKVTLISLAPPRARGAGPKVLCGRPVFARDLCEKHYADRIRLGGAA